MPRINGCQDPSAIQLQERAKRRRNAARGLRQRPGTPPAEYRAVEKPAFVSAPRPDLSAAIKRYFGRFRR